MSFPIQLVVVLFCWYCPVRGAKRKKNEKERRKTIGLIGHNKRIYICIIVVPEGERKEKETESIFKAIMILKISKPRKRNEHKIHEAPKFQNRLNSNSATLRHIIMKLLKV